MKHSAKYLFFLLAVLFSSTSYAIEVERFEKLNTPDGLSQSNVLSSFCDSRGYLWFGTMDGLNLFDGYSFKIYRKKLDDPFSLSSNRIVKIWEDSNHFIWFESHDGHYHYFDTTTERFYSFPNANELNSNVNVRISSFLEINENEVWLGTDNSGVYRLMLNENGIYGFQHYGSFDINPISNENVSFIIADDNSDVWIGTQNGVNKVKKSNNEISFDHFLIDHSFSSAAALDGKVWFGTINNGLISYNSKGQRFTTENIIPEETHISSLQKTKSGNLLIGTQNSGLIVINPIINQTFNFFEKQSVKRIFEDSQGFLWLITNKPGISRLNLNSSVEQHFQLTPDKIYQTIFDERQVFFEDRDGNIWLASHGGGLALYDPEKSAMTFFRHDPGNNYSLSSNIVYCITQDKSGLLWVGTGQPVGGINKIVPANPLFKHVQVIKEINHPNDNVVKAIFQDSKNNTWITTKSGHIFIYDKAFNLVYEFHKENNLQANISELIVYSIIQDNEGYIWLGSKGGGVAVSQLPFKNYSNYKDIKFNVFKHDPADNSTLSNNNIYSIIQDNNGIIWIGSYGGGINKVQNRTSSKLTCTHFNTQNSNLSSNEIRNIYQDKKQRIWFATTYGLNLLDNTLNNDSAKFISFIHNHKDKNSISYNDVVHIYEDSKERLWFGTFGGVNYLNDVNSYQSGFNHLTVADGLISDAVFGITGDNYGNIWFSTQNGISKFNPENKSFKNFDINNGLVCSEFNENSVASFSSGNLLFGNTSGMLIIKSVEVASNQFQPPVAFTKFLLFNQEVKLNENKSPLTKDINSTEEIILKHNQSSFSIEYAALSFFDPKKNQYSYTLENFDNRWYDVKNERKATFTNVPPGNYIFKVKASNWDGTWNETPREIKITILRPWYSTYYAFFGYFILLVIAFEFLRRTYTNYHRMQTDLKVEKRVNEIKLQFFTNISHEIRTPLTLILGPLEDLKKISNLPPSLTNPVNIMARNGKRILRLVNQLLDFRKIQNQKMQLKVQEVEMGLFIHEICQNFEQLAILKNIQFSYPKPDSTWNAWIDRDKIDSVLFNILSNAFKFTKNGKLIQLTVKQDDNFLGITITDEGEGISEDKLPLIFKRFNTLSADNIDFLGTGIGLAYSYELIKLHNGDIKVESTVGKGSSFTILIPLGNTHFSKENVKFLDNQTPCVYSHAREYSLDNIPEINAEDSDEESKKHKIVIVEDNVEVINYLGTILNSSFKLYHAFNGIEGMKLIHKIHPDIVITDLMMPEMDGMTMTKKIKEDFSISHIPVVMLTAKSAIKDQIEGIETGAEAYVLKPFNSTHLLTIVNNLLKQREILTKKFHSKSYSAEVKITNKDQEFIRNTIKLIEENCKDEDFNVNDLIKKSNLGRTVFFNKTKGLTGLSPVEFIRKIKLQIASKHLSENKYGVAEAAYLSGFSDVKYFTKCFKKEYGINPSDYKNQQPKFYKN